MLALSRGAKDRKKSPAIDLQEFCVIRWRDTLKSSYPNCYIMLIFCIWYAWQIFYSYKLINQGCRLMSIEHDDVEFNEHYPSSDLVSNLVYVTS